MDNWYVIQTKPLHEERVVRRLELAELDVFNPKIKTFSRGLRPLFPNYIFLSYDLTQAHNYHLIKYTRGVNKILGTSMNPVPISNEVIETIKERMNGKNTLEQKIFSAGSKVKVKRGILKDLIGILEKPVSDDGRVAVLLKLHEREMRARLNCKDIALMG